MGNQSGFFGGLWTGLRSGGEAEWGGQQLIGNQGLHSERKDGQGARSHMEVHA